MAGHTKWVGIVDRARWRRNC